MAESLPLREFRINYASATMSNFIRDIGNSRERASAALASSSGRVPSASFVIQDVTPHNEVVSSRSGLVDLCERVIFVHLGLNYSPFSTMKL